MGYEKPTESQGGGGMRQRKTNKGASGALSENEGSSSASSTTPKHHSMGWTTVMGTGLAMVSAVGAVLYQTEIPDPTGLMLGLASVVVGQICVVAYYLIMKAGWLRQLGWAMTPVQPGAKLRAASLHDAIFEHLSQPEGFLLLGGYLSLTWMLRLMPASYYQMGGHVDWGHVILQLLSVDFFQFVAHWLEHKIPYSKHWVYRSSHKPHHVFKAPLLTDAFNGSPTDTICMILVPLYITALLVPANVWSYMAFGTIYGNYLCLIHCEHNQPWDAAFRALGIGTPGDHHVHHATFTSNYGHIFMYWDRIFGTYRSPMSVPQLRV